MRKWLSVVFAAALLICTGLVAPSSSYAATTFTIINLDGAGEGFNDPTPAAPVGGNSGATLGQQRLIAFQHAADIWGDILNSPVEIRVTATFDPLFCTSNSATLGAAGPNSAHANFLGAPVLNTFYVQALANSLFGGDLAPGQNDMVAFFSSNIGTPGCLETSGWYYGLDANPPFGQIDFVTVLLHELGHGLGFVSLVNLSSGAKFQGLDDAYMRHLEDHTTGKSYPQMTNAERVAASVNTGNLHWTGANVVAASNGLTNGRHGSGHVQMNAPNPQQQGSSVSHFDTALFPNELMEPSYTGARHDPGLAVDLFADLGWNGSTAPAVDQTAPGKITDLKAVATTQTSFSMSWTAPGDDDNDGTATGYDLRFSTTRLNDSNWNAATPVNNEPSPLASGAVQTLTVAGLLCGRTYYVGIKTMDEANNTSVLSNVARARTERCNRLQVSPRVLPAGEANVAYNKGAFNIEGGAAPFTVQVDPATLPPGIAYGAQSFSGMPSAAGNYNIAAVITDNVGSTAKVRFRFKVVKPVSITTTSLKEGRANASYRAVLRARDGVRPYEWNVAPPLPQTLTLDSENGMITGVVNNPISMPVNFQVTDAAGGTANQMLMLTIE